MAKKNNEEAIESFVRYAQTNPKNRRRAIAQAGRLVNALASKRKISKQDLKNITGGLKGAAEAAETEEYPR